MKSKKLKYPTNGIIQTYSITQLHI